MENVNGVCAQPRAPVYFQQSSSLSQFKEVPVGTFTSFYFSPSAGLATLNIDIQDFL